MANQIKRNGHQDSDWLVSKWGIFSSSVMQNDDSGHDLHWARAVVVSKYLMFNTVNWLAAIV